MGSQRKLFGTDGIRGVANRHPITGEVALSLGRALAINARERGGRRRPRIVVGKDTRLSGYMLETALASGICAAGGEVMLVGPLPTPGISFVTSSMRADAGVVISASHNPYTDNGIKLFAQNGFKLPDEEEAEIERLMEEGDDDRDQLAPDEVGNAVRVDDAVGRYVVELKHTFPRDLVLDGIALVVDCANGAAYRTAPVVFHELGAEVDALGTQPDGYNINAGCGSLHPERTAEEVVRRGADIGISLDGDADRVILIDERGQMVDGDAVMALLATRMIREGRLHDETLVTTVMSNLGLDRAVRDAGGRVVRTPVGDRYVVEEMRRRAATFGGEQSGHLIFLEHATTGDGILAALQVLAVLVREQRSLSAITDGIMERVPQTLDSFAVGVKRPLEQLVGTQRAISAAREELGDGGRVLVRYSGTENVARVLVEGPSEQRNAELAASIRGALVSELG
ncbi:MAG: phosphoglucosamine mutase [Polyangia bacterium]